MSHNFTQEELQRAKKQLGVSNKEFVGLFLHTDFDVCHQQTLDLIQRARKAYRSWLLRLHPDHHPNRPDLHRQMALLNIAWSELKKLRDRDNLMTVYSAYAEQRFQHSLQARQSPFSANPVFSNQQVQMAHDYVLYQIPATGSNINIYGQSHNVTTTGSSSGTAWGTPFGTTITFQTGGTTNGTP